MVTYEDPEENVKLWIEVSPDGRIKASEHGFFTVKEDRYGSVQECDAFRRVPQLSSVAIKLEKVAQKVREDAIAERKREHLRKLSQGTM